MTSESLAVVRRFMDLVVTDDFDGMSKSLHPEVVWYGTRGGLDEAQVLRGPAAVLEYMREIGESWQRFDVEVEQIIEVGDVIVVMLRESAVARHGGLEVQDDTAMIFRVREQKIVEMTGYLDRDEALRAAGRPTARSGSRPRGSTP